MDKKLKRNLTHELNMAKTLLDSIPAMIWIKDEEFKYVYANRNYLEGVEQKDIINKSVYAVHQKERAEQFISCDKKALLKGCQEFLETYKNKWGKIEYFLTFKFPLEINGEKYVAGIGIDTTEQIEFEKRLTSEKKASETETKILREKLEIRQLSDRMIGVSKPMQKVFKQVDQVAKTNATVLILGETGTGKELIANLIHEKSPRNLRSMIKVNCVALAPSIIEAELFGHEKGAFTGAISRREGRFEMANGSTIFLDEIAEMPIELQSKLLRVLQDGKFERVGSSKSISVDTRVICATNKNLVHCVNNGSFRQDLYFRLNVFPISVSPLRERVDDIPLFVDSFLREFAFNLGRNIPTLSENTLLKLHRYSWPGNARELRNVIERAMILSSGTHLNIDLPVDSAADGPEEVNLDAVVRSHILKVLEMANWKVSGKNGAAERLGIKPTTLEYRMKKLRIRIQRKAISQNIVNS
jgi:PAS domain S-box-containing protein